MVMLKLIVFPLLDIKNFNSGDSFSYDVSIKGVKVKKINLK